MKGSRIKTLAWLKTRDRVATRIMWIGGMLFVAFWVAAVARVFIDELPSATEHSGLASTATASLLGSWAFLLPGIAYGWIHGTFLDGRVPGQPLIAPRHSRIGAMTWASMFVIAGVRLLMQQDILAAVLVPPATVLSAAAGVGAGLVLSAMWARLNDGAQLAALADSDDTIRGPLSAGTAMSRSRELDD